MKTARAPIPTGSPTITVRGGIFTMLPGSVMLAEPTENDVGLDEAKEMVRAMEELAAGKPFRLLIDERNVKRKMDGPGRKYVTSEGAIFERMAFVTGNSLSRFFASGVLMIMGLDRPARSFDSIDAALAWLREP